LGDDERVAAIVDGIYRGLKAAPLRATPVAAAALRNITVALISDVQRHAVTLM
jgi:hypothetical protein